MHNIILMSGHFYPRSPCGERRNEKVKYTSTGLFLSTLSLRRATCLSIYECWTALISIHALLAESDRLGLLGWLRVLISIHALLAESDHERPIANTAATKFLSTLSLRRATPAGCWRDARRVISIHALLAESDNRRPIFFEQAEQFLSTLSLRRATISARREARESIDFYPRSPCGERHPPSITPTASRNFYPRSPCGERP